MIAKQLFAAATLAVIGISAMAAEATQFAPEAGTLTRAEVRAELARAQLAGELDTVSAAYGGGESVRTIAHTAFDAAAARSRDEVRAEARTVSRRQSFSSLYVGG